MDLDVVVELGFLDLALFLTLGRGASSEDGEHGRLLALELPPEAAVEESQPILRESKLSVQL